MASPQLQTFFRCLAQAFCTKGLRALLEAVPFGGALYDIAADTYDRMGHCREEPGEALRVAAEAPPAEALQVAESIVRQVAPDLPERIQRDLVSYLVQVPSIVRQTRRRTADEPADTAPSPSITGPRDLMGFLPNELWRYRPGDRPPEVAPWELVDGLGMGGLGEVWLARHPVFRGVPQAALKFILDPTATDFLRRQAEALDRVLLACQHPNIVPVRQVYLDADPPCLEYEYISGGNLTRAMRHWRGLPAGDRVERATQVIRAVAEAVGIGHAQSPPIVHGDLKPANILLRPLGGGRFSLAVADFGIGGLLLGQAAALARGSTARGVLATRFYSSGTPLYQSPDQPSRVVPTPQDDVFALGVIWAQLLNCDPDEPPQCGVYGMSDRETAEIPSKWLPLLQACVAIDASERPADAAVLASEIAAVRRR